MSVTDKDNNVIRCEGFDIHIYFGLAMITIIFVSTFTAAFFHMYRYLEYKKKTINNIIESMTN